MSTRKDLLITIEQQQKKLSKYESKISDLIRAYKSLLKEKDALQASVSALTDSNDSSRSLPNEATSSIKRAETAVTESVEESDCESTFSGVECDNAEVMELRAKVATLKTSLKTLSTERNKVETTLKEDRKRILDDKQKIEDRLKEEEMLKVKLLKEYDEKIQDLRTKVLVSHHEREQETNNSVAMLRELESKLSKERNDKEKLETYLEEAREENRNLTQVLNAKNHEKHQKQITDMQNELEQVRSRLKKAEEHCKEPPILKKLQTQVLEMKAQYADAVQLEQQRSEAAEAISRDMSKVHEERVAALESKLTELSLTAASDDRTRRTHIQTIHILKEKLSELTEENIDLASKALGGRSNDDPFVTNDSNATIDNFIKLWETIKTMAENDKRTMDIEALLSGSDVIHRSCRNDYDKLKQDFERLKYSSEEKTIQIKRECSCGLLEQVEELKGRVRSVTSSAQTVQKTHKQQVASLTQAISDLKEKHEIEMKQISHEHRVTVANLEQQLAEHCQRSLFTLQERDEEIHRLTQEIHQITKEAQKQPSTVAAALLSRVNLGGSEGPLLHHLEEMARRDLEVSELSKDKHLLERTLRDVQMASTEKQQTMQDSIDDLQEEIARLNRNSCRGGENLEYLKNIVLQYMTSTDSESRNMILNAIAAVLKFSPAEVERVRKFLALWWWQTPNQPHGHKISISSVASNSPLLQNRESRLRTRYSSDSK